MSNDDDARSRRWFLRGGLGVTAGAITATLPRGASALTEAPVVEPEAPAPAPPKAPAPVSSLTVSAEVNGSAASFEAGADTLALDVLRDQLGLTSCKRSCGHGACGACTVHLDGVPVTTCMLPATSLEGRSVTTLEAWGTDASHPVQRAFLAEDALQCGFCTPGFVVEAIAFYDDWRSRGIDGEPTAAQVADALEGHLCRCGAYPAITRAVQRACRGDFETDGGPRPRVDGPAKVTGRARYTVDVALPNQAEAVIVRSLAAAGSFDGADLAAAEAVPGYLGAHLLTPVGGTIRYAGQELVMVAGATREAAVQAARAVSAKITVRDHVIDPARAVEPDAPLVYPDRPPVKEVENASEGPVFPAPWRGNLRGPLGALSFDPLGTNARLGGARKELGAGEPDDAGTVGRCEDGRVLAQRVFHAHVQAHTALEPHAAVASWEGERLTVHLSTQAVFDMAADLAEHFDVPAADVQVLAEYVGGGFGAKCTVGPEILGVVALARELKRPVRVALDRQEELTVGGLRPGAALHASLVTKANGDLGALMLEAYNDSGAAIGTNLGFLWRIMYPGAPRILRDYGVITHTPPAAPFRGPGGPAAFYALESLVDMAAEASDVDPITLRAGWDPNPFRQELYGKARASAHWGRRTPAGSDSGRYKRGVGLAIGSWLQFVMPRTEVAVEAGPDGVTVSTAAQDMGQGARTVLANTAAEVFGLDPHDVRVRLGDSRLPRGPASNGSRTTNSIVPAAQEAARDVADDLLAFARSKWSLQGAAVNRDGIQHDGGTLPWAEVFASAPVTSSIGKRRPDRGGYFLGPVAATSVGRVISASVQLAEVEVDSWTGVTKVIGWWGGFGVGRLHAPALARSQALGGIVQGISYTLYEDRRLDPKTGRLLTAGLEDYRIAGIGDIPDIELVFADHPLPKVRGGGVGIGEIVTVAAPGAIANAVHNATGWRPGRLPLRPDLVLAGLKGGVA